MKIDTNIFRQIEPTGMRHRGLRWYLIPNDTLLSMLVHEYWDHLSMETGIDPELLVDDLAPNYNVHGTLTGFMFKSPGDSIGAIDKHLFGGDPAYSHGAVDKFIEFSNAYLKGNDAASLEKYGIKMPL